MVLYDHDNNPATAAVKVFGLIRHDACGMVKNAGGEYRCPNFAGKPDISWFSLVTEALVVCNLSLWTAP